MRGGTVGGGGGGGVVVDCHCEWMRGRVRSVEYSEGFVNQAGSKCRDCCRKAPSNDPRYSRTNNIKHFCVLAA